MAAIGGVLAAFGLAAAAGLNAYIPLLMVALTARFTDWFKLGPAWDPLTSWWVIGALVFLVSVVFFADKLPAINHANDAIQRRDTNLCQACRRGSSVCSQHQRSHRYQSHRCHGCRLAHCRIGSYC